MLIRIIRAIHLHIFINLGRGPICSRIYLFQNLKGKKCRDFHQLFGTRQRLGFPLAQLCICGRSWKTSFTYNNGNCNRGLHFFQFSEAAYLLNKVSFFFFWSDLLNKS